MTVVYLDIDDNGCIIEPNHNLIRGNIILKIKGNHNEIKIGDDFLAECGSLKELDLSGLKEVKKYR